jgi:sensor histidine kinase regulating citrate/malate metabolism
VFAFAGPKPREAERATIVNSSAFKAATEGVIQISSAIKIKACAAQSTSLFLIRE